MGAFITLFAVAIDPLSQQLITYRQSSVQAAGVNATVPMTNQFWELEAVTKSVGIYDAELFDFGKDPHCYSYISVGIKSAIRIALDSGKNRIQELPATCPSGNCDIEKYRSLAVCSSFADVTEHSYPKNATKNDPGSPQRTELHLTNDHYLVHNSQYVEQSIDIRSVDTGLEPASKAPLPDIKSPLANTFVIVKNATIPIQSEEKRGAVEGSTYAAFEVALSWCVATYDTGTENGTSTTTKVSDDKNFTYVGEENALVNEASEDQSLDEFSVDVKHHASLQWFLKQLLVGEFNGTASRTGRSTDSAVGQILYQTFQDIAFDSPKGNLSRSLRATEREGLQFIFENVATSVTKYIRLGDGDAGVSKPDYQPSVATGKVYEPVTLVQIRWPWIAAHIYFALHSAGLLLATILCHRASPLRGQEPWKSSGMAILHALEPDLQRGLRGIAKISELQGRAEGHRVRLEKGEEEWRLVSMGKKEDWQEGVADAS